MKMPEVHPFTSADAKERYLRFYDMKAKGWPLPSETRMAATSYGPTFVRISGPAGAPPLVLLPGAATTSLMWKPNVKELSGSFRTYAVDNIYDYGLSVYTRPINGPNDYVSWLDDLFTALGLGNNVILMGLSYGGWLAGQYLLQHPQRLDKVVLLAPGATVLPIRLEFWLRTVLAALPFRYFSQKLATWLFADLNKSEFGRRVLADAVDELMFTKRCFKARKFISLTVLTDQELRDIKTPTLFMVGENEKLYSAAKAIERLNRTAPQIKTEIIPDAGHDLAVVQADLVNATVLQFLKEY